MLWCPLEVAIEGPHLLMISFVRVFLRWLLGRPQAVTTGYPLEVANGVPTGGTRHDIEINIKST